MFEQYYSINNAFGIAIDILQDGSQKFHTCEIEVKNGSLNIKKKITEASTIENLKKALPQQAIVSLNLAGKGILYKEVAKVETIDQKEFSRILPNANSEDFYIQNFVSSDRSFVSIIRKSDADFWIGVLKESGFQVLMLSLGPFPVANIIDQLNVYNPELIFDGHHIMLNEKADWIAYHPDLNALARFPFKIDAETIDEKLIIPYAAAFQLALAAKVNPVKAEVSELEIKFGEIITNKKLQVKGALILAFFFIILLINFLVFSWLNISNNLLADQVSRSTQSNFNAQSVNDQIKQKQLLLQNLGWDGSINKSAMVDQLAALLPEELTWTEITINPIDQELSRLQKTIAFTDREIKITGSSAVIIPVNEWIARIKTKPWVKNIQLESYAFNNELKTGQFTVIINY